MGNVEECIQSCLQYANYFDVALILHQLYKGTYVVTNIKKKTWFSFHDNVWEEKKQVYEGRGVTWGKKPGQCKQGCVKNTERKWWQWREKLCPEIEDQAK